jgi:hypothetical protein
MKMDMKQLTYKELHLISGGGEYFDSYTVIGGKIGGSIMTPVALIMAATGGGNPVAPFYTAPLSLALGIGAGVSAGTIIGGIIGASIDYLAG